jgi:hypothetical protein
VEIFLYQGNGFVRMKGTAKKLASLPRISYNNRVRHNVLLIVA